RSVRAGAEYFHSSWIAHTLGENGDGRAFIRSHQGWFLQEFRQVSVDGRVPTDDAFEWQTVHLRIIVAAFEVVPATAGLDSVWIKWIVRFEATSARLRHIRPVARGLAVQGQAEQAIDPRAPRIQLAGRMGVRVDDAGCSADALQADGLPHQKQLVVHPGWDNDQVTGGCVVDGRLDRVPGRQNRRHPSTNRHRYSVNR